MGNGKRECVKSLLIYMIQLLSFYSLVESMIPEILQVVLQKGLVAEYLNLYELEWTKLY